MAVVISGKTGYQQQRAMPQGMVVLLVEGLRVNRYLQAGFQYEHMVEAFLPTHRIIPPGAA